VQLRLLDAGAGNDDGGDGGRDSQGRQEGHV
jgi:hypothetical protein